MSYRQSCKRMFAQVQKAAKQYTQQFEACSGRQGTRAAAEATGSRAAGSRTCHTSSQRTARCGAALSHSADANCLTLRIALQQTILAYFVARRFISLEARTLALTSGRTAGMLARALAQSRCLLLLSEGMLQRSTKPQLARALARRLMPRSSCFIALSSLRSCMPSTAGLALYLVALPCAPSALPAAVPRSSGC